MTGSSGSEALLDSGELAGLLGVEVLDLKPAVEVADGPPIGAAADPDGARIRKLISAMRDREFHPAAIVAMSKLGRRVVPTLVELLRDGDADIRLRACQVLQKLGGDASGAVPALAGALGDPDLAVRRLACQVLAGLGPDAAGAVPALVAALAESDEAAAALAKVGGPGAQALLEALSSEDSAVRTRVLSALGSLPSIGEAVILRVIEVLNDPDEGVHAQAWDIFRRFPRREPSAFPAVLRAMRSVLAHVREQACRIILDLCDRPEQVIPALSEALRDPEPAVRDAASHSLSRVGEAAIVPLVERTARRGRRDRRRVGPRTDRAASDDGVVRGDQGRSDLPPRRRGDEPGGYRLRYDRGGSQRVRTALGGDGLPISRRGRRESRCGTSPTGPRRGGQPFRPADGHPCRSARAANRHGG